MNSLLDSGILCLPFGSISALSLQYGPYRILLSCGKPHPIPAGIVVLTYIDLMGRVQIQDTINPQWPR